MVGDGPAGATTTVDLRGRRCPMTFVFTKLALERASPGDVVRVILDYPPSFENVPRSVEIQRLGTVIGCEGTGGERIISIRRG